MPSPTAISVQKLARLVGTAGAPQIVDVRSDADFAADPRLIPASAHRPLETMAAWSARLEPRPTVVVCEAGHARSEGAAAWLRDRRIPAETLEGGFAAWRAASLPAVPEAKLPPRDDSGRTVWVTRARPKIDRIACPWLIRRFVDPAAVFLFVSPSEVAGVAERFQATPFDVHDAVFWTHRGDGCTFDTMVEEFGLATEPLLRLATIVRAADTGRLELAPEAAGLLAVSLGLSRAYADDLAQLDAGMGIYDALYRWARDATAEVHSWAPGRA